MIILMLGFAQAYDNSSSMKIESRNATDELSCAAKCGVNCLIANLLYPICYAICLSKCNKAPADGVYNCLSGCGLTKPIKANTPADRDRATQQVDSCLQECQTK
uniref:Uncharacterized protein n=2 Tax=Cajanus cajan TaxID=3821 RepID=A0A151QR53_CAJCA|nr:hypothetical protein KK1_046445 [Cajanus cajan]